MKRTARRFFARFRSKDAEEDQQDKFGKGNGSVGCFFSGRCGNGGDSKGGGHSPGRCEDGRSCWCFEEDGCDGTAGLDPQCHPDSLDGCSYDIPGGVPPST